MSSSFEDLDAKNPATKTVHNLNVGFKRLNIFKKES